jgi:hypothetical protein
MVQINQNFGGAGHASAVQQLSAVTFDAEVEDVPPGSSGDDEGGSGMVN